MKAQKKVKPYADFPLTWHPAGQWCKKIRGKVIYFGTDANAALAKYLNERDDRQAGRTPRSQEGELTVAQLCNIFLTSKKRQMESGELAPVTWRNYYDVCERLVDFFKKDRAVLDLVSDDFERLRAELAKTRKAEALASSVQKVRTIFKYAYDANLIDRPVRHGPAFRKPSRKTMRKARQAAGVRLIEADEIHRILDTAKQPMRAMVLLAINGGFGQSDCASLPLDAIDLKAGWVNFPRPKTAVPRRFPLWPETIAALREAISMRPTPKDQADAGLTFITKYGAKWVRVRERDVGGCVPIDSINLEFCKLLVKLGIKRRGGFYLLRHTFRTIADNAKDQIAADAIMGHVSEAMSDRYRERIDDERLQAVAEHVRQWLWPPKKAKKLSDK